MLGHKRPRRLLMRAVGGGFKLHFEHLLFVGQDLFLVSQNFRVSENGPGEGSSIEMGWLPIGSLPFRSGSMWNTFVLPQPIPICGWS